jgi:hypothetical protein
MLSVMSCVDVSLNVPVAVNCCVLPTDTDGFAGEIATETNVPVPTISVAVPLMPELVAVIVTVPAFLPWARPEERIEANWGFEDFHATLLRVVATLPSLKVPVAVNFKEVPAAICALAGVTVMLSNFAVETVKLVEPLTEPNDAAILVVPVATLVTSPWLFIVAVAAVDEVQSADAVMSCVVASLKVPVAVNSLAALMGIVELAGATDSETRVAPVTVTTAVPLIPPQLAVTVMLPAAMLVARPDEFTVNKFCAEEDQAAATSANIGGAI